MLAQNTNFLSVLLLGFYIKQVLSQCLSIQLSTNQVFVSQNTDSILIEKDSEDIQNFKNDYIKQSTEIQIQSIDQIISTLFIESPQDHFRAEKWLCYLYYEDKQYYISCICNILIDELGNVIVNNIQNKRLKFQQINGEECKQIYLETNSQILIFCFFDQKLRIRFLDLDNTIKNKVFDLTSSLDCPQQKVHKVDHYNYLISFYQCQNWQIIQYYKNDLIKLANSEILDDLSDQKIIPDKIQFCDRTIVIIQNNMIYLFFLEETLQLQYQIKLEGQIIKSVLFSQSCRVEFYVSHFKVDNKKFIRQFSNSNKYFFDQKVLEINYAFNQFFFQFADKVKVGWLDEQVIELYYQPQSLHTIQQYNLLYFIDQKNYLIRFFKIDCCANQLKPTKRFIFEIPKFYFEKYESQCFQIEYINKQKPNQINYEFINECQPIEKIIINREKYDFSTKKELKRTGESENQIKYFLEDLFVKDNCPSIEEYLEQNTLIYYRSIKYENQAILLSNDTLQTLYCNNQSTIQKDVKKYEVFYYLDNILLIKKKPQYIKLNYFQIDQQQNEFKLYSQIKQSIQSQEFVLIIPEDHKDLLLIDLLNQRIQQISQQFQQFLINNNQKINFFFFAQVLYLEIFQINEYLLIQTQKFINYYKVEDVTIINVQNSKLISKSQIFANNYHIIAIHNTQNLLKYYILEYQLKLLENYIIEEGYDIIRPFKYQIIEEIFVIAMRQLDQNYLFIFQISKSFELLNIIKIGIPQFFIQSYSIYYYNQNKDLMTFDIKNLQISYLNPAQQQKEVLFKDIVPIQYKNQMENDDQLYLHIKVLNFCRNLIAFQNEQIIQVHESEIIRIEDIDIFSGPIDKLVLENNDKLQLVGPFIYQHTIEECTEESVLCLQQILIRFKKINNYQGTFYFIKKFNNFKIIPFYKLSNQLILKDETINNIYLFQSNLLLHFFQQDQTIFANLLQFIDNQILQQFQPVKLVGVDEKQFQQAEFHKSNQLILIKLNQSDILFRVHQNQLKQIEHDSELSNIKFVQKSNNQYIEIKYVKKIDECYFKVNIFQLNQTKINLRESYKIDEETIQNALSPHINNKVSFLNKQFNIQLLQSFQDEDTIKVKILQISSSFSVISKIVIDMPNYDIIYEVFMIIRNPKSDHLLFLEYFDDSILILKDKQTQTSFLYFQNQEQITQFYDYKYRFDNDLVKLYPFNTTHYLFHFKKDNQFKIGEVGFEILRLEKLQYHESCTLKAFNKVSQSEVTLIIERSNFLSQEAKLITTSGIILGSYYLLRRHRLKQQEIQNQQLIQF